MLTSPIWRPLLLSTLAGLSTTIGALLSVVYSPTEATMAVLLGLAIGVMATVSIVELVVKNALEHSAPLVIISTAAGAMVYYVLEPLIPKAELQHLEQAGNGGHGAAGGAAAAAHLEEWSSDSDPEQEQQQQQQGRGRGQEQEQEQERGQKEDPEAGKREPEGELGPDLKSRQLLRLGLLMALTMTLHNLPEGFAVAFSAFTPLGPIMTLAIAMHNIPEGLIIAAPIYAATGSRWKALGLATASGLSEPVGALVSLLLLRPFLTVETLQYVLAGTGGLMLAVCVIELWPEARNCRNDKGLALGIGIGAAVMGWTLYVEEQVMAGAGQQSWEEVPL